jgi:ATP-dependent DNA helicase RecG
MKFVESKIVELKSSFTKSLLKTVSAFSNFFDGTIYIGVDDQGNVIGIENIYKEKIRIENIINTSISPKPNFDLNVIKLDTHLVIEIIVYKGDLAPYYFDQKAYIRNDTSTIPLDGNHLTRLILKSKNLTFDQMPTDQKSLTFNVLEKKLKDALKIESISTEILKTLGLYHQDGYNHAALLLSDHHDLSSSYIDIAKFKLDTNTFYDRKRLSNLSMLSYFDELMTIFKLQYPEYDIIKGIQREKKELIPLVAFREAISNALLHRDYLIQSGVQISFFENRIEISSPGGLPEGMDENQFFKGLTSVSRNPILTGVFFRLNLIEQFGTGVNRIIENYKHYHMKPSFIILDNQIRIILPITNFDYTLLEKVESIKAYLRAFPNSSRESIEQAIKIEKHTLLRRLQDLEQDGIVKKNGAGPNTTYLIP